MQSPDSTTGEPAAVRRRVDLDGGFTACTLQWNGHQSPEPEVEDEIVAELGDFLDWPITLQQAVSIASEEFNKIVAGDPNMSREETGYAKCRKTEDQNYASVVAENGGGPSLQSPDSSTGEPAAVGRRVDLDGGFTACTLQWSGYQSPEPEPADKIVAEFGDFLDWPLTLHQPASIASGEFSKIVGEDSDMAMEERGYDKCRTTEVESYVSGETGDGQPEKRFVASDASDSCKVIWVADSERFTIWKNEKEVSQSSDIEDDNGTDPLNISPFVGCLHSLVEQDIAYKRASGASNQEKNRGANVSAVIAEALSRVCKLIHRFDSVATVPLSELVAQCENGEFRSSCVRSSLFEKRLRVIRSQVHQVIKIYQNQATMNSTIVILDTTGDEENRMQERRYPLCQSVIAAQKPMNVIDHPLKVISKLYDIAERFVSKTEISCQLILNCLETTVTVVTRAVITSELIEELMGALESNGQSLPALRTASTVIARWTHRALEYAQRAIDLHRDAYDALRVARCDLDAMKKSRLRESLVLKDIAAAEVHLVNLIRRPDVNSAEIRMRKLHMKTMRRLRMKDVIEVGEYGIVIEQWSATCSDILTTVLQTLCLATQSTCNTIEGALKAAEDIIIPAAISLKNKKQ